MKTSIYNRLSYLVGLLGLLFLPVILFSPSFAHASLANLTTGAAYITNAGDVYGMSGTTIQVWSTQSNLSGGTLSGGGCYYCRTGSQWKDGARQNTYPDTSVATRTTSVSGQTWGVAMDSGTPSYEWGCGNSQCASSDAGDCNNFNVKMTVPSGSAFDGGHWAYREWNYTDPGIAGGLTMNDRTDSYTYSVPLNNGGRTYLRLTYRLNRAPVPTHNLPVNNQKYTATTAGGSVNVAFTGHGDDPDLDKVGNLLYVRKQNSDGTWPTFTGKTWTAAAASGTVQALGSGDFTKGKYEWMIQSTDYTLSGWASQWYFTIEDPAPLTACSITSLSVAPNSGVSPLATSFSFVVASATTTSLSYGDGSANTSSPATGISHTYTNSTAATLTRTATLSCTGAGGNDSRSVVITVNPSANPSLVLNLPAEGQSYTVAAGGSQSVSLSAVLTDPGASANRTSSINISYINVNNIASGIWTLCPTVKSPASQSLPFQATCNTTSLAAGRYNWGATGYITNFATRIDVAAPAQRYFTISEPVVPPVTPNITCSITPSAGNKPLSVSIGVSSSTSQMPVGPFAITIADAAGTTKTFESATLPYYYTFPVAGSYTIGVTTKTPDNSVTGLPCTSTAINVTGSSTGDSGEVTP